MSLFSKKMLTLFKAKPKKREAANDQSKTLLVEKNGNFVIKISDPVYYDMYWNAYTVDYIDTSAEVRDKMQSSDFWNDVKFFDPERNDYIPYFALVALTPFDSQGRLIIRDIMFFAP